MKNKIFLTSMFAVMLAFPAYASYFADPTGQSTNYSGQIAAGSTQEDCDSDPLQYQVPQGQGESYGTYTLTAQWTPNQYTVTYDCNGGTVNSSLVDSVDSNGYGIDNVIYNTTSYTFQHQLDLCTYANQTPSEFTCTHNADGTPWFVAQTWDIPDDVTCTAHWSETPYTITYDCGSLPNNGGVVNGGTFENSTNNVDTVYNGQNYSVKSDASGCGTGNQLAGYHFAGWSCTPNLATGSGSQIYSVDWPTSTVVSQTIASLGISADATCDALWQENGVNLRYLENAGDVTPYHTDSCQYGNDTFTLPAEPSKTGYTFTGWKVTDWDE